MIYGMFFVINITDVSFKKNIIYMETKKFLILIVVVVMPLFFTSCNDDDGYSLGDMWVSIGTVDNPENGSYFTFTLDNGTKMWAAASDIPSYRPKSGQRLIAYYTIISDKPEDSSYDHDVVLRDAYNVLTKGIFDVTPETQDSIGYDPVKIEDIWIGNDYLNIRFGYNGQNKTHYINLVNDVSKTYDDGKVHLEFRHNANDDAPSRGIRGYVSFDLKSLQNEDSDQIELVIHAKEFDTPNEPKETIHELTYDFGDSSETNKAIPNEELTEDIR